MQDYNTMFLFIALAVACFAVLNYIRAFIFKRIIKHSHFKKSKKIKSNILGSGLLTYVNKVSQIATLVFSLLFAIVASGTENKFLVTFASKSLVVFLLAGFTYFSGVFAEKLIKKHFLKFSDISLITGFVKIAIYIIGAMVIVQSIGIHITPIITALGIGGIAFAFAIQPTLANFFSGLNILASGQISQGDYIVVSDTVQGYVKDVAWRNTSIQSLSNVLHIVPNQVLSDAVVSNYNKPKKEFFVTVTVGVSYSSDLDLVENVTLETAKKVLQHETIGVDTKKHAPVFRYSAFGDSSVDFWAILPILDVSKRSYTIHLFIKELHKSFNENNIEIPFPIRVVKSEKA